MTVSTCINTELERKKANCTMKDIESNIPRSKTGSPEQYEIYTTYILQHLETLFSFYERITEKRRANLSVIKGKKKRRNRKRKKKKSRK
ncbi:hypothetical protein BDF20DRAFT_68627 [Mycotypha africana]|uniref:uncharacterized protein n=1 Tax=Mycotypha africana TaxID=64632 RepID=UPI002300D8D6|nr:uncharacterized protein BDF20DRAFT_68627 [Mycotypha africana]KAI8991868.1 hypothetical protein BDF20DRAFT_68627 [Mycotypha africana]